MEKMQQLIAAVSNGWRRTGNGWWTWIYSAAMWSGCTVRTWVGIDIGWLNMEKRDFQIDACGPFEDLNPCPSREATVLLK